MPNSIFQITFSISAEQWAETARHRVDPEAEPIFDSFYGDVQIIAEGVRLLPEDAYHMSVADLACGMAEILRAGFPYVRRSAVFRQADDSLEIMFEVCDGRVRVVTNTADTQYALVHPEDFVAGVRAFIEGFIQQARARIQDALSWKDLQILREPIAEEGQQ